MPPPSPPLSDVTGGGLCYANKASECQSTATSFHWRSSRRNGASVMRRVLEVLGRRNIMNCVPPSLLGFLTDSRWLSSP